MSNNKESGDTWLTVFAISFLGIVCFTFLFIMSKHRGPFEYSYEDLRQAQEHRQQTIRENYQDLINNSIEYVCEKDVKCFKTPFCDIYQSGDQTVVYDAVSKEQYTVFMNNGDRVRQGSIGIAAYCLGTGLN